MHKSMYTKRLPSPLNNLRRGKKKKCSRSSYPMLLAKQKVSSGDHRQCSTGGADNVPSGYHGDPGRALWQSAPSVTRGEYGHCRYRRPVHRAPRGSQLSVHECQIGSGPPSLCCVSLKISASPCTLCLGPAKLSSLEVIAACPYLGSLATSHSAPLPTLSVHVSCHAPLPVCCRKAISSARPSGSLPDGGARGC